ncbi:MAG TPA: Spy/CpxP family protein refolding chaperone [Gammaproteobacteria bacterium]|nr:Spy/CpxP family protein refolding chaperone [Gammaproteobacteria bacterium]
MKKSIFAAVGAVTVAGLIALANPAGAHGGFGKGRAGGKLFASSFQIADMARHLDMTEEQKAQLREVLDAARPEADRLADAMLNNREAMKAFRESETYGEEEIRAIADEKGKLFADMMVLHARVHKQIRAILTPEQLERFEKMRKRHGGRRHHDRDAGVGPRS